MNLSYLPTLWVLLLTLSTSFSNVESTRIERLIDGIPVKESEFNYVVAILLNGKMLCTGGIIGEQYVLTAAHCFFDDKTNKIIEGHLKVVAGTKHLIDNNPNRIDIDAEEVYLPKVSSLYTEKTKSEGDVAVLKLKEPFQLEDNDYIESLTMPESTSCETRSDDEIYGNTSFTVAGFGANELKREPYWIAFEKTEALISGQMYKSDVTYVKKNICNDDFSGLIKEWHICGRVLRFRTGGVCQGDSGAPLVEKNTKKVIAVLSATSKYCKEKKGPGVYTKVSKHRHFIKNALANDLKDMYVEKLNQRASLLSEVICWIPFVNQLPIQRCTIQ